jgi:hypothetical protein
VVLDLQTVVRQCPDHQQRVVFLILDKERS